jgi:PhnB protein
MTTTTTTTASQVKAIPKGFRTVTPHLTIRDADKAIVFYKRALGAKERMRVSRPDGKVMHAELKIGNSIIFLGEESPERGCPSPLTAGSTTVALYLYVKDVDKAFARAMKAGVTVKMPVGDMFWGDRAGTFTDPFGHQWTLATHKEEVPVEELPKRAESFFKQMAGQSA